ncbi:putative nucleoside hydrolase [Paratrimastix pyriformis]|uniref:Nucleoside hydrolase n=1 Tax=Paratrimastix pyriformis TaxID=342808 RepID=A0ABQ8UDW8_9EUKA|nr:putative nucleoside hydrolase [Paratrimastix pyriformis]
MGKHKVIIDTDPGIDDAVALMLALSNPDIDLLAITTVSGNQSLVNTTRNAQRILRFFASGDQSCNLPPLYRGCDRPLVCEPVHVVEIFGSDGFGDADWTSFPEVTTETPATEPQLEHASNAIVRLVRQYPNEVSLVCIGPLTNIAVALRLEPALPTLVRQIVVMGGSTQGVGNTTAVGEFNVCADPEAAKVILEAFPG